MAFLYQDDGPPNPEPELYKRLDGFPANPVPVTPQSSLLDRTDRNGWPDIVELDSPIGGSGKR